MTKWLHLLALTSVLILSGCASPPRVPADLKPTEVMLAPGIRFTIPRPQAPNAAVSVTQSIVGKFGKRNFAFSAQIQISGQDLKLVGLDGLGRRALTLSWNAAGLRYAAAPWMKPKLRPADILADVAMVYWQARTLETPLSAAGLTLVSGPDTRLVTSGGRPVVAIRYGIGKGWNRSAALVNYALGYTITIQSQRIGS